MPDADETNNTLLQSWNDLRQRKKTAKEQIEEQKAQIGKDLVTIARTEEGARFLRALMLDCGYQSSAIVVTPAGFDPQGTLWNESRRGIWLTIRSLLPADVLYRIEINPEGE